MNSPRIRFDLLAWRPFRAIMRSPAFPVALQAALLVALVLLAANGLGLGTDLGADELLTFRKTNLTTLTVWGLWWPGMIVVALVFGRAWCTVCPMELVNRVGDAIARRGGWSRARLGRLLRNGWMIVALYLALQLLVAGASLHRVPHYTALLLLVLLGGALLSGLVFGESRSFCRAFCPAGALLSVYGRHTPVQLETRDPAVCDGCATKDCIRKENRHRFDRRSCPSRLQPFERAPSDGCVLCLQCAKVCPHENLGVGLVISGAPVRRKALLRPYEAAFVMVALGFVAHEVIGEVKWLDAVFHVAPLWLAAVAPAVPFCWIEALWFLVLFPLTVWGAIAGVGYLAGHRAGLRSGLLAAATGAAPVVAVAHLSKASAKLASWGGYLPLAIRDPQGLDTFGSIAAHARAAPAAVVGLTVMGWLMLVLILVIAWKAWRWTRLMSAESVRAARVGLVGVSLIFAPVLVAWGWP